MWKARSVSSKEGNQTFSHQAQGPEDDPDAVAQQNNRANQETKWGQETNADRQDARGGWDAIEPRRGVARRNCVEWHGVNRWGEGNGSVCDARHRFRRIDDSGDDRAIRDGKCGDPDRVGRCRDPSCAERKTFRRTKCRGVSLTEILPDQVDVGERPVVTSDGSPSVAVAIELLPKYVTSHFQICAGLQQIDWIKVEWPSQANYIF